MGGSLTLERTLDKIFNFYYDYREKVLLYFSTIGVPRHVITLISWISLVISGAFIPGVALWTYLLWLAIMSFLLWASLFGISRNRKDSFLDRFLLLFFPITTLIFLLGGGFVAAFTMLMFFVFDASTILEEAKKNESSTENGTAK